MGTKPFRLPLRFGLGALMAILPLACIIGGAALAWWKSPFDVVEKAPAVLWDEERKLWHKVFLRAGFGARLNALGVEAELVALQNEAPKTYRQVRQMRRRWRQAPPFP